MKKHIVAGAAALALGLTASLSTDEDEYEGTEFTLRLQPKVAEVP